MKPTKRLRFRNIFLAGGSAAVLGALYWSDPDHGITTAMLLLALVTPLLAVGFAHLARKALHDYPEADARKLFAKAGEHPIGAGLALVALSIVMFGLLGLFGNIARAQDVQTYVPPAANQYLPTLAAELDEHWPDAPSRAYVGALIEHESCITLRHGRCWNPTSRLKTAREEGAGLGQLTRAWNPDGSTRFDALAELRQQHPALRELGWHNIYQRPDLQLRATVLKLRGDYNSLRTVKDPQHRLDMVDSAYNGGMAGLQRERRACEIAKDCDPQQWFDNVERYCLKSKAPLYAGRSACDINRHHVTDVRQVREPKYRALLGGA